MDGLGSWQALRLFTLTKRQFTLVFVTFFTALALILLIGISGPEITESHILKATDIEEHPDDLRTAVEYPLETPELNPFNQQLWLTLRLELQTPPDEVVRTELTLTVVLLGITGEKQDELISDSNARSHNYTVICNKVPTCNELVVLHLGSIAYGHYFARLRLHGLGDLAIPVRQIYFTFMMYNKTFTLIEVWFRFFFVLLSFIIMCVYGWLMLKVPLLEWTMEQKWTTALLPMLVLYNDPLFPVSFALRNWVPVLLDAGFQASFLAGLLLFWLCAFHDLLLQPNRRCFLGFYLPKLVIVGPMWLLALTLGVWRIVNENYDPSYHYRVDAGVFLALKVVFFLLGGLYLCYLFMLVGRSFRQLKQTNYHGKDSMIQVLIPNLRLKFLTVFTFIVLAISFAILFLRFGIHGLQDNFVAELSTHYKNSAEFLTFFAVLNFYMYTLAFVYSPSKFAASEYGQDENAQPMLRRSYSLRSSSIKPGDALGGNSAFPLMLLTDEEEV
ncbi:transmembrane protein 181-like [Petromyzon marinus]|uniref:Transmembrane protein 181-like n=1 Tax=Petromyzon marinus TaxID=7757 RepID=A0AAJ7U2N2_PETMA|nr:transmembrane protein 181-like [Petromyzon marinus]XP_032828717.1 transmembrane protein 181-like [Petromyzon marinus]